jgi:ribosomal protein S18 acetylase RimI-like enzyme
MIGAMDHPITLRTVERFAEPMFTELVNVLLHDADRLAVRECLFGAAGPKPVPSQAQQVRVGAFDGEALVGWSHAYLQQGGTLYVANSAVAPDYRRRGLYTRLVAAMEQEAKALGCFRIESHHRASNPAVLIAKLKAGYTIIGTEFSMEMGLLLKMSKQLDATRQEVFEARAGVVEGSVRFFGGY